MRSIRLGTGVIAVAVGVGLALAATFVASPPGAGAQTEVLRAAIAPGPFTPTDTVRISSIDVCLRGASVPQINTVVTAPNGDIVIDQWHLVGTQEPGVVVDTAGNWSVELQLRDDLGQPTGEPFPSLGTYTVQVDCVTTYLPQVRIHYNPLTFVVGDGTPPPTTTPPGPGDPTTIPVAPVAAPIPGDPDITG